MFCLYFIYTNTRKFQRRVERSCVQLLNVTIKGEGMSVSMSVQHGRKQRQLYTPDKALYQFKQAEGKAMAPTVVVPLGRAMLALVLIIGASTITTLGVYNNYTPLMYTGLVVLIMLKYIHCVKGVSIIV